MYRIAREIFIIFFSLYLSTNAIGEETITFPDFDQKYWEDAYNAAKGKNLRGVAGIVLGLSSSLLSIPFAKRIKENPSKYYGFTLMSIVASLSLAGHGIGSIDFANEEKEGAREFIDTYKSSTEGPSITDQEQFYLFQTRKNKVKLTVFSDFIMTEGIIALGSGLSQYAVDKSDPDSYSLKPLRPIIIGGSLIVLGALSFIRSFQSQRAIENTLFQNAPNYLPNSAFTEDNKNSRSRLALKKGIGITSLTTGSLLTILSIWELSRMFSASFGKKSNWYYDPDRAIPAFISTFSGGLAMILFGSKAVRDALVFQEHDEYLINNNKIRICSPHTSFGILCSNNSYGCIFVGNF